MKSTIALVFLALAISCSPSARADTFGTGPNAFTMDFISIGNAGNPADTSDGDSTLSGTQLFGSVGYDYRIGQYEVSEDMLNKASAAGSLGITHKNRGANFPAAAITWYEAARFVNWLNTSQGYAPAYKFAAQPGDPGYTTTAANLLWQPADAGYNASNPFRNSLTKYALPTADEWYKAAYYNPAGGVYYDYPTGSDSIPDGVDSNGDATFDLVVWDGPGGDPNRPTQPNTLTNVGLGSPYGTFAQGGNLSEWEETEKDLINDSPTANRGHRGGEFYYSSLNARATQRSGVPPSYSPLEMGDSEIGLRVVSLPGPPIDYVLTVEYQTPESTGPLIEGFDPLPATITARFTLKNVQPGQTTIGLDQVTSFDLTTPGASPTAGDLDSFQLTRNANGSPQSLTYNAQLAPGIDLFNNNFTLEITGTDPDTQQEFRYFWSESDDTFVASPGLTGDYNADDTVVAPDYILWRMHALTANPLPHDPLGAPITHSQYDNLRANFAETAPFATGSAATTAVPEPATLALALLTAAALAASRRFTRSAATR